MEQERRKPGRLLGTRVYLCGAMDRVTDGGVTWRASITPKLNEMGVIVFNPAKKPVGKGIGDETDREERREWVSKGMWTKIRNFMRRVRGIDLRMVNITDFTIIKVDPEVHMCGSYEEIAIANHEKKPILIWVEGGKGKTPWWLFGMVPHEHIFSSEQELLDYLHHVDTAKRVKTYKRWYFFDFDELYNPVVLQRMNGV